MLTKLSFALCLLAYTTNAVANGPAVEIVAGTGSDENNGDSGDAIETNVGQPFGVEIGPDGALYITEVKHHRIRRLNLTTGALTTVAGNGLPGYAGDGGLAVDAAMNEPYEIRFDRDGNMFIVEMKNHIVRRIDAQSKSISTVAGTGKAGFSGDGGPATKAQLNQPHSIALDEDGAVYVADIGNHRIRRIDAKTGAIETIAGNTERALPRDGQLAIGNSILGPRALFVHNGTLWIALREGHSIWRMSLKDGALRHVAGTGKAAYSGDNGPAATATFNGPKGIAVGREGDVYIADSGNNAIRRIDNQTNVISTVLGPPTRSGKQGNASSEYLLNGVHGICVGADGTLYIGDTMNHRVLSVR